MLPVHSGLESVSYATSSTPVPIESAIHKELLGEVYKLSGLFLVEGFYRSNLHK